MAALESLVRWRSVEPGAVDVPSACALGSCPGEVVAVKEHRIPLQGRSRVVGYCRSHAAMYGVLVRRGRLLTMS